MTDEERRLAHITVLVRNRDAWTGGDIATMFGLYADDFILHWNGANPFAGTHRGQRPRAPVHHRPTRDAAPGVARTRAFIRLCQP